MHWLFLTILLACGDTPATQDTSDTTIDTAIPTDRDGDGFAHPEDCDDGDDSEHPGAIEDCDDGADDDCDGKVDECFSAGESSLSDADAAFVGSESSDWSGYALTGVGDVDGDSFDDILIGAPRADVGGSSSGAAYLVSGPVEGSMSLANADAQIIGDAGDTLGIALAAAGDLDGDGLADFLVGASTAEGSSGVVAGAVYVWLGPATGALDPSTADAVLLGDRDGEDAGWAVAGVGDVDGDGTPDILVGAPGGIAGGQGSGVSYLVRGPVAGRVPLRDAYASFAGEDADDTSGNAVASAGDIDGDGLADLLIGAAERSDAAHPGGAAYLVLQVGQGRLDLSDADAILFGGSSGSAVGAAVIGAGDVDGDGTDDVVVGASTGGSANQGAAYLFTRLPSGAVDVASSDAAMVGENGYDYAGSALAAPGDVDRDGRADVLVGAQYHNAAGKEAGAAYLVLGPISGTLGLADADSKFLGEAAGDLAGFAVGAAGDVDGDGAPDLLVGARANDWGASSAGISYLLLAASL